MLEFKPRNIVSFSDHHRSLTSVNPKPQFAKHVKNITTLFCLSGYTQLKILTPEVLVQLLQKCVPKGWLEGSTVQWKPSEYGHPPSDWLERIWTYLSRSCPNDLNAVQNLPIIPVSKDGEVTTLAPLSSQNALICKV